jgi:ADP-ribosylglycohydrolase
VTIPADRFLGSILAGAVGDALGAPIEFDGISMIRRRYGDDGVTGYVGYGGNGDITDDTQMTLFTMEGLIRGNVARRTGSPPADLFAPIQHAYQRWYHTQGPDRVWAETGGVFATGPAPDGWLITHRELFSARAPGNTVMSALRSFARGGQRGSFTHKLNDSKGCGAVMRAAPVALLGDDAFAFAAGTGLLTHSHPSGYLSAGALAHLVHLLLHDVALPDAVAGTRAKLLEWDGHEEQVAVLDKAVALGRPTPEQIEEHLGGGWVGEEAFAIGVCAALAARDLRDGLLLAVNHSGDSDSTGAICGNILGAIHGTAAIPREWLDRLELRDVTEQLTRDALAEFGSAPPTDPTWLIRYPPT